MSDFIRNKNSKPLPNSKPKKNNTRRVAISIIIFTIIGSILGFISFGWLIYGNFKKSSAVAYADEITTSFEYSGNMYVWYQGQPVVNGIKFLPRLSFGVDNYNLQIYLLKTTIDGRDWYNSFLENGFTYNTSADDTSSRFYQYYRLDSVDNSITGTPVSMSAFSNSDFTGTLSESVYLSDNSYNFDYTKSYCLILETFNPQNYYSSSAVKMRSYVYFTSYGNRPTSFDSVHIYRDTNTINNQTDFIVFDYYYQGNICFSFFIYNHFALHTILPYLSIHTYSLTTLRNEWRYFPDFNSDFEGGIAYGRSQGLIEGENKGYDKGYAEGKIVGNSEGFYEGYNEGLADANDYTFLGLISSVVDAPIQAFRGLFSFNVFGVDMTDFLLSIFSLCIVITVIKMFV